MNSESITCLEKLQLHAEKWGRLSQTKIFEASQRLAIISLLGKLL